MVQLNWQCHELGLLKVYSLEKGTCIFARPNCYSSTVLGALSLENGLNVSFVDPPLLDIRRVLNDFPQKTKEATMGKEEQETNPQSRCTKKRPTPAFVPRSSVFLPELQAQFCCSGRFPRGTAPVAWLLGGRSGRKAPIGMSAPAMRPSMRPKERKGTGAEAVFRVFGEDWAWLKKNQEG